MTDFTEQARAEAERIFPTSLHLGKFDGLMSDADIDRRLLMQRQAFELGTEWARDHLAAQEPTDDDAEPDWANEWTQSTSSPLPEHDDEDPQEPTDAEVEAVIAGREERGWLTTAHPAEHRDEMRAILSDARAARQARQEKR